jgi:hypothetical protein
MSARMLNLLGARTGEAASTLTPGVAQSSCVVEPVRRSFEMAFRPSLFCDSSGRVSSCLWSDH